ncbi:PEP-CTERM sorting domain-containing protein [Duganella sp. CY15W]|uniref:PEP-CTERM sorting domain-containing protein n=1 Tax=Duganella sp. CY15W TaxID=2692172 RepID=UPI0035A27793
MDALTKRVAVAAIFSLAASGAQAAKVFDAGKDTSNANCAFNTVCGPATGTADDYAAQLFTLGSSTTLKSASYVVINQGYDLPTEAKWQILAADGTGGLPGTVVASGTSNVLAQTFYYGHVMGMSADAQFFGFNGVTLASGSYYFAIQAVSPSFTNFLAAGTLASGAAEYYQGNWRTDYQTFPSISLALYDHEAAIPVPEPSSYAMMLGGIALLGVVASRRSRTAQSAT